MGIGCYLLNAHNFFIEKVSDYVLNLVLPVLCVHMEHSDGSIFGDLHSF